MMEEDKMTRQERNAQRKEKQTLRRSRQSDYMRDMMDDLEGRPEEVICKPEFMVTYFALLQYMHKFTAH